MKKLIWILLCVCLLVGCGAKKQAGVANPVQSSSREEIAQLEGVTMNLPEGAEDAQWSRIVSGEAVTDQVQFTYDGGEYCYRVKETGALEDISGMYYEWGEPEGGEVPEDTPRLYTNGEGQGLILWYRDGHSHSISLSAHATTDKILSVYYQVTGTSAE